MFGTTAIGSLDDQFFCQISAKYPANFSALLWRSDAESGLAWNVLGNVDATLDELAEALRLIESSGVAKQWRNEKLAVRNTDGQRIGRVERGACRALGISAEAVHLVGCNETQQIWIQKRALTKTNDPGKWDTMVGGMISAGDTLESALARETWEEAGITLDSTTNLRWRGRVGINRPNTIDGGVGYVDERIDWFECLVPGDLRPISLDGEVEQFALVERAELKQMLASGAFTLEAAMILVHYVSERPA